MKSPIPSTILWYSVSQEGPHVCEGYRPQQLEPYKNEAKPSNSLNHTGGNRDPRAISGNAGHFGATRQEDTWGLRRFR